MAAGQAARVIDAGDLARPFPGLDVWDHWPVQERDGRVAMIAGGALVMLLAAPVTPDPEARHALARLRLAHRGPAGWRDLGWLLPDGLSPGSREWAGSAVIDPDHGRVTLFFTAVGERGEAAVGFDQRIMTTEAALAVIGGLPRLSDWTEPVDCVRPDGACYVRELSGGAAIGTIKAFRDPFFFHDPAAGDLLVFAASLAASPSRWNGAVGLARRASGDGLWRLLPPLAHANGVNNEMERPHLVRHAGRLLLFWSTQQRTFAADGPAGPNGLYGAVAETIDGPWRPLNGTGLVLANPAAAPFQAYSWLVLDDLTVWSFADLVGLPRSPRDVAEARACFAGVPAPVVRLRLAGDTVRPEPDA